MCERRWNHPPGTVTALRTVKITRRMSGGVRGEEEVRNQQKLEGEVRKGRARRKAKREKT